MHKRSSNSTTADKPVNLGRHERNCSVCAHADREGIEAAYVDWQSPATIAIEFSLKNRSSVYRHADAVGLRIKRQRNVRVALERLIERGGDVDVTGAVVVSAIQAYSKINASGQWVDRTEQVNLNDLYQRMNAQELEAYAKHGTLPAWFEAAAVTATTGGSQV